MQTLPSVGALVAQKYRIEALLGQGGMGAVFRAHHELIDKPVALKWLKPEMAGSPEARERFVREARAAARIRHPNVVHVYDVGSHEGSLFMVMELLEGESLAAIIERGSVPVEATTHFLLGAMRGVAAAHACGITHRDIKPDNILIVADPKTGQGLPKILDFGISKIQDEALASPHITQAGLVVGTPIYMSMEQLNARSDLDHRADIYSFGVLLYQLFTGQLPFDGASVMEVVTKIATERPLPPSRLRTGLSPAIDAVVMKAMAYRREDRYQTLEQLIEQVSMLLANGSLRGTTAPVTASGPQPTPQIPLRSRAHNGGNVARLKDSVARAATSMQRLRVPLAVALGLTVSLVWASWDTPGAPASERSSVEALTELQGPASGSAHADNTDNTGPATSVPAPAGLVVPPPVHLENVVLPGVAGSSSGAVQPSLARGTARVDLRGRAGAAAPDAGLRSAAPAAKRVELGAKPAVPARNSTSELEPPLAPVSPVERTERPAAPSKDSAQPAAPRRSGELRREDL